MHKNCELTQPKTTSAVSIFGSLPGKTLASQISRSPPRVSWSPSFVHGSVTVTTVGYAIDFPLLGFATAIIITVLIYSANQSDNLETYQRRLNNLSVWKSFILPLLVSSFLHRELNDAKAESLQMADWINVLIQMLLLVNDDKCCGLLVVDHQAKNREKHQKFTKWTSATPRVE